ncbi:MAG TPA: adenylate cyclase regulatory domain-containing protein [Acidimicrobiia bacterium]|nr:adenylate cyclase regulatory domain-containing protein [Acidimicrobiia bacterium]
MDEATFTAAGLYDPDAPGADERLRLLDYLVGLGATLEDLQAAHGIGMLQRIVIDLVRRTGGPLISSREVADRGGVRLDVVERVVRAAGLPLVDPDQPVFREEDADAFALFEQGAAIFGDGPTLEFTRTIGAAMASIADSAMALFGIGAASRFDVSEVGELEQAKIGELASTILNSKEGVLRTIDVLFFHHVGAAVRRSVAARSGDTRTATYAVGFVDLVASTALNRRLGPAELAEAIGGFERAATEVVTSREGRVVKTIGDEIMFVNADPGAACETALALRDAVHDDPRLGTVRGGLAYGELVLGYGDFYGAEVNLAARLVRAAEPGQILVTEAVTGRVASSTMACTRVDEVVVAGFDDAVDAFSLGYA